MAIWLTSESQHAIFVADAVLGETNFAHPDWTSVFDTDRAQENIGSSVVVRPLLLGRVRYR